MFEQHSNATVVSRQSSYERVWSKPMTALAREYGISVPLPAAYNNRTVIVRRRIYVYPKIYVNRWDSCYPFEPMLLFRPYAFS